MDLHTLLRMPGHLIRRAQQVAVSEFNAAMEELDLTSVQLVALVAIRDNPCLDATRLAELVHTDKATIGGVISRMEKKGLIARTSSGSDLRVKELNITAIGAEMIAISEQKLMAIQEKILGPLAREDRARFMRLLALVARATE